MILGLEDLPGEVQSCVAARHGPRHGGDIHERLVRGDGVGEGGDGARAVGVGHRAHAAREACHRMEHADAEPIAQEGFAGGAVDPVGQGAVSRPRDGPRPREMLGVECPPSAQVDREGVTTIVDDLIDDVPRARRPVAVLEDDVDAAQDLLVGEAYASDVARVVVDAERTGDERPGQSALPTR
jgi:hypothetical protein